MRIYKKKIERIVITGPMNEMDKAYDYCYRNGYKITRSGPKYIGKGKVNPDIFKIIAERANK